MQISDEERDAIHPQLDPIDRDNQEKSNNPLLLVIAVLIIGIVIAIAGYYYLQKQQTLEQPAPQPIETFQPAPAEEPEPPAPEVPVREVTSEPEFSLPPLDLSDTDIRERLINLSADMAPWLQTEELIRRGTSFTDGLTRGELLTNLISIPPPEGGFEVVKDGGNFYIAEENYQRYQYLINIVAAIDPEALTNLFDLYRPLLEKSYGELGYKPESLGGKVIIALDQILSVPVNESRIQLKRDSVYYTYADPQLENLSSLQKQLIRMGPEATRILQQKAQAFKDYLLKQPEPTESSNP